MFKQYLVSKKSIRMKCFFLLLLPLLFLSCSDKEEEEYEWILTSLGKNYITATNSDSSFLMCWKSDKKAFAKDSILYSDALRKLYQQDIAFMRYLLKHKSQEKRHNNWIVTANICKADYYEKELMTNREAVKIIVDNLLLNQSKDTIIVNGYIKKVKFEDMAKIIDEGDNVRDNYLRLLSGYRQD